MKKKFVVGIIFVLLVLGYFMLKSPSEEKIQKCLNELPETGLSHIDFCFEGCCYQSTYGKIRCNNLCNMIN